MKGTRFSPIGFFKGSYTLKTPAPRGLVVFSGFRQIEKLPAFYAGVGAFVHPALEESWGLVINEAMASGLPVLSSNNVCAVEELVVHGKTGFLFDPQDEAELAEFIRRVVDLPEEARRGMGRVGREMLEKKSRCGLLGSGWRNFFSKMRI